MKPPSQRAARLSFVVTFCGLFVTLSAIDIPFGFLRSPSDSHGQAELGTVRAIELINDNDSRYPDVNFELDNRTALDRAEANDFFLDMVDDGIIALMGPPLSSWSLLIGITAANFEVPVMSYSATNKGLSDKAVYDYFFRSIPSDTRQANAIANIVLEFGWTRVAVLSATDSFSIGLTEDFIVFAGALGIDVLTNQFINSEQTNLDASLENVRDTGARVIVVFMLSAFFRDVILRAHELELTGEPYVYIGPDGIVDFTLILNEDGSRNRDLEDATLGLLATSPYRGDEDNDQLEDLLDWLDDNGGPLSGSLRPYTTFAYDGTFAYAEAIQAYYNETDDDDDLISPSEIRDRLRNVSFSGASGRFSFDTFQDRDSGNYSLFNWNGGDEIIVEVGVWSSGRGLQFFDDIVWPSRQSDTPTDQPKSTINYYSCHEEDDFTDRRALVTIDSIDASDPDNIDESYECDGIVDCENWSDEGFQCGSSLAVAYIVIGILLVLMVLIVLFFLITVAYYHKRGRVRATGPLFLYLVCGASIVGILSVFTFYGRAKDFPCVFRYWLVFPAAIVLTSSLFAKQYRVWRVFGNKSLSLVSVTQRDLLLIVGGATLPVLLILGIWMIVEAPIARKADVDGDDHLVCHSDNQFVFIGLMLGYLGLMLVLSSVMAFYTRNHPSAFADAKIVGLALYNATIVGAIGVAIMFVLRDSPFGFFIFTSLGISLFFFSTCTILLWPKVYGVYVSDKHLDERERHALPGTRQNRTSALSTGGGTYGETVEMSTTDF